MGLLSLSSRLPMSIRFRPRRIQFLICGLLCLISVVNVLVWLTQDPSLYTIHFPQETEDLAAIVELGARHLKMYKQNTTFPPDEQCFFTPDFLADLDCDRIIDGDKEYIQSVRKNRIGISEVGADFPVDCASIHARGCYSGRPLSAEESAFPLAYANVVYKDYVLLESILNAIFAPQNSYCYVMDSKASSVFKAQLRSLAYCFPNVHVLAAEYDLDHKGHNMNEAFLACYEYLLAQRKHWKYVISIQNHDMPLRTNRDIVRILKIYNGSNDVEVTPANKIRIPRPRPDAASRESGPLYSWTLDSLRIVRRQSLNLDQNAELSLTKGGTATMLTREFIHFILRDLDLTEFLRRLNRGDYIDEMLISSLHASVVLQAPGGFTAKCMKKSPFFSKGMTRSTHWYAREVCQSDYFRHGICIQSTENVHEMDQRHGLFMNKFLPEFDYGAIFCHLKKLLRRKANPQKWPSSIDTEYYNALPFIRHHKLRQRGEPIDFAKFDCSLLGKDLLI